MKFSPLLQLLLRTYHEDHDRRIREAIMLEKSQLDLPPEAQANLNTMTWILPPVAKEEVKEEPKVEK